MTTHVDPEKLAARRERKNISNRRYRASVSAACAVDGCDNRATSKVVGSLCGTHRDREYTAANTERVRARQERYREQNRDRRVAYMVGYRNNVTQECSISGCETAASSNSLGSMCPKHRRRLRVSGEIGPSEHLDRTRGNSGKWVGDEVSYNGAHHRVRRARGSASEHACADCGGPAEQWSYRGGAEVELYEIVPGPRREPIEAAYSPDPEDYDPRCMSCHVRYDCYR